MGYLKYMRQAWNKPSKEVQAVQRERLLQWRREPATVRIENPTRIDRARSLGYKAKPGFVLVRQRVERGGRMRATFPMGRKPKQRRRRKIVSIPYQLVAEQRAAKQFVNCEVLNSYFVAQDGKHAWYEVLLVDKSHPAILADNRLSWIGKQQHTGRVRRGLTSAGKGARGLRRKGKGAEKLRPSRRARNRKTA